MALVPQAPGIPDCARAIPAQELSALNALLERVYRARGWHTGTYHYGRAWDTVLAAAATQEGGAWKEHFSPQDMSSDAVAALARAIDDAFAGGLLHRWCNGLKRARHFRMRGTAPASAGCTSKAEAGDAGRQLGQSSAQPCTGTGRAGQGYCAAGPAATASLKAPPPVHREEPPDSQSAASPQLLSGLRKSSWVHAAQGVDAPHLTETKVQACELTEPTAGERQQQRRQRQQQLLQRAQERQRERRQQTLLKMQQQQQEEEQRQQQQQQQQQQQRVGRRHGETKLAPLRYEVVTRWGHSNTWVAYFDEDNVVYLNTVRWTKALSASQPMNCEGTWCTSQLEVLVHTLAHELVHALVFHCFPDMDAYSAAYLQRDRHGPVFQLLNRQLFGHTSDALRWVHGSRR